MKKFYLIKLLLFISFSIFSQKSIKLFVGGNYTSVREVRILQNEIIDSLVWSENTKIAVKKSKGKLQISDLYKQIDADTSSLKQQVKWEKERLKYMGKLKGLEVLLGNGVL